MAKPILLVVDDDPAVLRALGQELRRHHAGRFRVLHADSGASALQILHDLAKRNAPVALLLVDHRMPEMTGEELLAGARELFPDAKRVLLVDTADIATAARAIATAGVHDYANKPWSSPDEALHPTLDDLLADWEANARPRHAGIRVVGHRWAADSHAVKDFLARHEIPYQWLDIETREGRRLVHATAGADNQHLPVVLLSEGEPLIEPTTAQFAERLGLRTRAGKQFYDLIIVGGGPAGLAAAVYGASEGLRTALIEREAPGGQAGTSSRIENYLGFPSGLSGGDLARRAVAQAERFGVEILSPQGATGIRVADPYRYVALADGTEISCHALLIATGVQYRTLDVPGVAALTGAGVYYGAAQTEAPACAGDAVFLVGGANSAGQAAMYFSRYAMSVTILIRGGSIEQGMSQYLIDEIVERPNIRVRTRTEVAAVHGTDHLEGVTLVDNATGARETVPGAGLFIFIGALPRTDWLDGVVERDAQGFILSGADLLHDGTRPRGWTADRDPFLLETSVPGIFVVGDVRHRSVKRVAAAVGEGAMAVMFIHQYLSKV